MNKHRIAILAAALIAGAAFADSISVNGQVIPESRIKSLVEQQQARGQSDTPELRAQIREHLINTELLLQAAKAAKIDSKPDVKQMLEEANAQIMARAYIENHIKTNPVSDANLKAKYDELMKGPQFSGKEYHARHILVKTEAEAKAILAELKKGKKFETLAKKSIDTGSAPQGGDLGWGQADNYVPEFASALKSLAKGKITEAPVKSQFGYHIIKMENVRDVQKPKFEEVKQEIAQQEQQQQVQKLLGDLRAKASIK